jgi:anthranilate/para-aminobenzoate synthase component II
MTATTSREPRTDRGRRTRDGLIAAARTVFERQGFAATRYHSLLVDRATFPAALEITAETAEGEVMGLRHRTLPIWGVQFHPESIATEGGMTILKNFLSLN